jgi:hypothetical protein
MQQQEDLISSFKTVHPGYFTCPIESFVDKSLQHIPFESHPWFEWNVYGIDLD